MAQDLKRRTRSTRARWLVGLLSLLLAGGCGAGLESTGDGGLDDVGLRPETSDSPWFVDDDEPSTTGTGSGQTTGTASNPAASNPQGLTQPAASTEGGRDCREDYKEYPWTGQTKNECSECPNCPGEGFMPGIAFLACKIEGKCYRFATILECNFDLCPKGSCLLPQHNDNIYCRKDGINITYFICRINGVKYTFQTLDGTYYFDKAERGQDIVTAVADSLPLPVPAGCEDQAGIR